MGTKFWSIYVYTNCIDHLIPPPYHTIPRYSSRTPPSTLSIPYHKPSSFRGTANPAAPAAPNPSGRQAKVLKTTPNPTSRSSRMSHVSSQKFTSQVVQALKRDAVADPPHKASVLLIASDSVSLAQKKSISKSVRTHSWLEN